MSAKDTLLSAGAAWQAGDLDGAGRLYHQALVQEPETPGVQFVVGTFLAQQAGMSAHALQLLTQCEAAFGDDARYWSVRGACYAGTGDFRLALACHKRSVLMDPENGIGLREVGNLCYLLGKPDEGRQWHDEALDAPITGPETRYALSYIRLLRGEYARGWNDFEARKYTLNWRGVTRAIRADLARIPVLPRRLADYRGQRVLVWGEMGLGDSVMFRRFADQLADRTGMAVTWYDPRLAGLYATPDHIVPSAYDYHIPAGSLPMWLGTDGEDALPRPTVPEGGPWAKSRGDRLRVAIQWTGNVKTSHDADRSCYDEAVRAQVAAVPVEWVTIEPKDWRTTTDILRTCDLCCTVDTALFHVAGALGMPVWVIPPTWPELRWRTAGTTTPWYPTATVYRRPDTSAWGAVADRIITDLRAYANV